MKADRLERLKHVAKLCNAEWENHSQIDSTDVLCVLSQLIEVLIELEEDAPPPEEGE